MAIRRQKIDRDALPYLAPGSTTDIAPGWAFTIDCPHHGKFTIDFKRYRRCRDELVGQIRDGIWNLRHELVGSSLQSLEHNFRTFWRFLDHLYESGEQITHLNQIDRSLIDRFLTWLELQTAAVGKRKGFPLSPSAKRRIYGSIKTVLVNRQKRSPSAVSSNLSFPRNPYPNCNRRTTRREPYSASEQDRIDAALSKDLAAIYNQNGEPLPIEEVPLSLQQVLAVHLLVLARTTGRNLQPLLELRRDSLQEHPLPDRETLVTYKRRGYSTHLSSIVKEGGTDNEMREDSPLARGIPKYIGDYFRGLVKITAPLIPQAASRDREAVFLQRVTVGERKGQVVRLDANNAAFSIATFAKRHALLDDRGQFLMLNVARMRPTFGHELYRRTRDIRAVQQALGHANADTTARYYVGSPLEAERDHALIVSAWVDQFTRLEVEGKVLLAADGKIPLKDIPDLITDGYSTGIARCRNPFREKDAVCKKFFPCFSCPSMIIFEDDLWRLFSFYYRLLNERTKISPAQWLKTYGPIIRRIDVDIAPQFSVEKVEVARLRAQQDPHPTWKGQFL